ncbi:CPBP family intramembrane glutamic endopeptidase [Paenibacillus filicis]|uniref:CPBP family intramembrane glutamic endopeptidase n=1 Tax=Paenibacillus filicis TaxID=669464 RepID=A0ABU9DFI3_9BACL
MLSLTLWLVITGLCLPGIWLMTRYTVSDLAAKPDNHLSERTLGIVVSAQTILVVAIAAAAGIYFAPKVGITDRFLVDLSQGRLAWADLYRQLWAGLAGGIVCALVWMGSYYGFLRPRIDRESVRISESTRHELGLWTRITSGGMTEEVLFRWGLLSFTMWAISLTGTSPAAAFWISIIITGVLFGLAHLPGHFAMGCKKSPILIGTTVLGNLWVSILCGFLLWQYGLIAAILVHILFHVIWYPWDRAAALQSS